MVWVKDRLLFAQTDGTLLASIGLTGEPIDAEGELRLEQVLAGEQKEKNPI